MKKIVDYILAVGRDYYGDSTGKMIKNLKIAVLDNMEKGYIPIGGVSIEHNKSGTSMGPTGYVQAMVKYEDEI